MVAFAEGNGVYVYRHDRFSLQVLDALPETA